MAGVAKHDTHSFAAPSFWADVVADDSLSDALILIEGEALAISNAHSNSEAYATTSSPKSGNTVEPSERYLEGLISGSHSLPQSVIMGMSPDAAIFSPQGELAASNAVCNWEALAMQQSDTISILTRQLEWFSFPAWVANSADDGCQQHFKEMEGAIDTLHNDLFPLVNHLQTRVDGLESSLALLESKVSNTLSTIPAVVAGDIDVISTALYPLVNQLQQRVADIESSLARLEVEVVHMKDLKASILPMLEDSMK